MKFSIETARDQHRVKTEDALRAKQAAFVAKNVASGLRSIRIHESNVPIEARVNNGRWLFDCDCGSGVAADPDFAAAYCFGCGAIHTVVVFPDDRADVERVLLERPKTATRNWEPPETVATLETENRRHGVRL